MTSDIELCGKANCGCRYHAEDGTPCIHDLALALQKGTINLDEYGEKMSEKELTFDEASNIHTSLYLEDQFRWAKRVASLDTLRSLLRHPRSSSRALESEIRAVRLGSFLAALLTYAGVKQ